MNATKKAYFDGLTHKEKNPHDCHMKFIWDFIVILVATFLCGIPLTLGLLYLIANILWP